MAISGSFNKAREIYPGPRRPCMKKSPCIDRIMIRETFEVLLDSAWDLVWLENRFCFVVKLSFEVGLI